MIKFVSMLSDKGLFIANQGKNYQNVRNQLPTTLKVNGITEFSPTHHNSWKLLDGNFKILSVEQKKSGHNTVNIRWELNEGVDIPEVPKVVSQEDSCEFENEDYYWEFGKESKYYAYRALYKRKYDLEPLGYEKVEFEVEDLGSITTESLDTFAEAKVALQSQHTKRYEDHDLSSVVVYSELAELLVPDVMLHNQPCSLSQDNTYHIIRNYVKENINREHATISSDYDFCFTVQKKVHIKPLIFRDEIKKSNNRSYAKPRFNTRTVTDKKFDIFSMCPAKKYSGYTPIQGFRGDNLKELHDNMKQFLDELIQKINEPLQECECCSGTGYETPVKMETNKR